MRKFVYAFVLVVILVAFAAALLSNTVDNAEASCVGEDCHHWPWPTHLYKVFIANVSQCSGKECFWGSWDNPVEPGR